LVGWLLEQCMYRDIVILIFLIQNLEFFGNGTFDPKKSLNGKNNSTKALICVTPL
jgi:hypothetical protein